MRPKAPQLSTSTPSYPTTTTTTTTITAPSSPPPTTTTPSINQINREEWDTAKHNDLLHEIAHCNDELKSDDTLRNEINKISQKKKIMRDPPGYNNTGLYMLKYEHFKQNSENQKFQSHENQSCVPTDLTNIHRGNSSRDTTTTTTPVPKF